MIFHQFKLITTSVSRVILKFATLINSHQNVKKLTLARNSNSFKFIIVESLFDLKFVIAHFYHPKRFTLVSLVFTNMANLISFKLLTDSILENLKEGENDDIAEQMKNSGLKLTDENQLNSCALHLFEKALIDKSFSRKCSLIAQAIANVTVPSSLDPALSVSFREAMVRLTHKHFKAVKEQQFDSESCCAVLNFLADLYKVDFLSTQIINYWRTSLQEAPTSELGKYFTDIVQDIQSSKTDQNMYRELYKKVMISDMKKALSIPNLSSPALG